MGNFTFKNIKISCKQDTLNSATKSLSSFYILKITPIARKFNLCSSPVFLCHPILGLSLSFYIRRYRFYNNTFSKTRIHIFIVMEVELNQPKQDETDNPLKRKVFRLEWLYSFLVIFTIIYPPIVLKYILSDIFLVSQQSPMTSSNGRVITCNKPKDLLDVKNPADEFKTKNDYPKTEQINEPKETQNSIQTRNRRLKNPRTNLHTKETSEQVLERKADSSVSQKSIKSIKTQFKNNERVIDRIPSASHAFERLNLERNKEKKNVQPPGKLSSNNDTDTSRRLEQETSSQQLIFYPPNSECNGTWFHLDLRLDDWPTDTSWELLDIQNNKRIANESYSSEALFAHMNFTKCIESIPHRFTLFDSFGDGISCGDLSGCYEIYFDEKLIIDGPPFAGEVSYDFDLSSLCPVSHSNNTFVLHTPYDHMKNNVSIQLVDSFRSTEVSLAPFADDNIKYATSYSACLAPGLFSLIVTNHGNETTNCGNETRCNEVFVNDVSIVSETFKDQQIFSLDFLVSTDGSCREAVCPSQPLLAPFHPSNPDLHDETIANALFMLHGLSSPELFQNFNSPQYKAACFVLYDDPHATQSMTHLIEQYAISVFYFSTGLEREIMNTCEFELTCNAEGYITEIVYGKYCF